MDAAHRIASQDLANELHALLEEIDPARWRDEFETAARQRAEVVCERLRSLAADLASDSDVRVAQLRERMVSARATIDRALGALPTRESLTLTMPDLRAAWTSFQHEVQPAYEALAASLRGVASTAPRALRPTNYRRNAFHMLSGFSVVTLCELLPSRFWLIALPVTAATWAWSAEISRRIWPAVNERLMRLFGAVAHAHERHRVNSATWFASALVLLAVFAPRFAAAAGVAVLGFGDPCAALVGRRFGRTKLRAGRSLQGSLAFVAVGTLAATVVLSVFHRGGVVAFVVTSLAAAFAGALAELLSDGIDDNFSIPVCAGAAAWIVGRAFGVA